MFIISIHKVGLFAVRNLIKSYEYIVPLAQKKVLKIPQEHRSSDHGSECSYHNNVKGSVLPQSPCLPARFLYCAVRALPELVMFGHATRK